MKTEYPEDFAADGTDYKNDAREAVALAIKSKMVTRLGRGKFQRSSEEDV